MNYQLKTLSVLTIAMLSLVACSKEKPLTIVFKWGQILNYPKQKTS